jgi:two-component system response regulator MprA
MQADPTILIADDDQFYQQIIARGLKPMGGTVLYASDGENALKLMKNGGIDVAIIDYHLPGLNGEQILESLKELEIAMPIILVTADESIDTERRVRGLASVCFFTKPFSLDDLRSAAQAAFDRRALPDTGTAVVK